MIRLNTVFSEAVQHDFARNLRVAGVGFKLNLSNRSIVVLVLDEINHGVNV